MTSDFWKNETKQEIAQKKHLCKNYTQKIHKKQEIKYIKNRKLQHTFSIVTLLCNNANVKKGRRWYWLKVINSGGKIGLYTTF